jgi:hypothetical protein
MDPCVSTVYGVASPDQKSLRVRYAKGLAQITTRRRGDNERRGAVRNFGHIKQVIEVTVRHEDCVNPFGHTIHRRVDADDV